MEFMDVQSIQSIQDCIDNVVRDFGHLDILVNNAGIRRRQAALDVTEEDFIGYEDIKFKNENKLIINVFPYHKLYSNSEYKWFNILQENEFNQSNMYVNKLFKIT